MIAYNLGNLWRRLVLPKGIGTWSLTSLQQRLMKTGGRLVKHARYYWLLPAESHLTRRLFGSMLRRMEGLPLPTRQARQQGETSLDNGGELTGEVSAKWIPNQASHGFLAWAEDLRGQQGLRRWNECEKVCEPSTRGYILWWLGKQNGNSG